MHLKWQSALSRTLGSSVALLLTATSLHAIPRDPCECPPPPVCCVEPAPGPFAFSYPFDRDLQCARDFYVYADGLLMQAKQDGMDFVIGNASPIADSAITQGKVGGFSADHDDYGYQPGARVGLGFYMDHDAWELGFEWTWMNVTEYQKRNAPSANGVVIPLYLTGVGMPANAVGGRSSAVWNVSFNTFDINLGKPFHVSRYFVMNPFFGLRAAWIDQHFSVDYGGTNGGAVTRVIHHGDNDFNGVGTRAGLRTDWLIGKGWSLFGNVSLSMLFGKFEVEQTMSYPTIDDGFDLTNDFYQNVPNLDMAVGVEWGTYFDKKRYHVGLKLAYEFQEWFDQLNMRRFFSGSSGLTDDAVAANGAYASDVVSRGNLTFNGFSLRLQFDM